MTNQIPSAPKAEQAEAVEADEDGAAFVADDAEGQREMKAERADDEHDDDARARRSGSGKRRVRVRRLSASVKGMPSSASLISTTSAVSMATSVPGGAHGDADIGGGQRGRVVDAVADHRGAAGFLQLAG